MQQPGKLRMTTQRRVIMEELKKLKSHPTAGELCEIVRRRLPRISLGTVYRNLEILSRQGLIQKLDLGGTEMRFDGDVSNHYHLRCLQCGRVMDAHMAPLADLEQSIERDNGFRVMAHRLEFMGLCRECQDVQATG